MMLFGEFVFSHLLFVGISTWDMLFMFMPISVHRFVFEAISKAFANMKSLYRFSANKTTNTTIYGTISQWWIKETQVLNCKIQIRSHFGSRTILVY